MHHKRGRPKNARAGCIMCKFNKVNGWNKEKYGHVGFSKLRAAYHAGRDINEGIERGPVDALGF